MADDAWLDRAAMALVTNDGSTYRQRAREWLRMFDAAQRRPEDG